MERHDAEHEPCPDCGSAIGVTCVNRYTGEPLNGPPAHGGRITARARSAGALV